MGSVFDSVKKYFLTGATDDAAAAGQIFPAAAIYQATPDEVDDGDFGRLRMSARRGLITATDSLHTYLSSTALANYDDILVKRNASIFAGTYVAPTTAFFDGADAGMDTTPMWIKIPMTGWREVTIGVYNVLSQNITIALNSFATLENVSPYILLFSVGALASGATYQLSPDAGGTGAAAGAYSVPAMRSPAAYFVLCITPAVDPSTGYFRVSISRRT